MTLPRTSSNSLPHAGHRIGTGSPGLGSSAVTLRLAPSCGHTTKFTRAGYAARDGHLVPAKTGRSSLGGRWSRAEKRRTRKFEWLREAHSS
jgi:hypothetical protein